MSRLLIIELIDRVRSMADTPGIQTIDNIHPDWHDRYAQDLAMFDQDLLQDASVSKLAKVPTKTEVYSSNADKVVERRFVNWADFDAPPHYFEQDRLLFTKTGLTSTFNPETLEVSKDAISSQIEHLPNRRLKRKGQLMCEALDAMVFLGKIITDASANMAMYQKG